LEGSLLTCWSGEVMEPHFVDRNYLRKPLEVLVAVHFLWKTCIVMRSHVTPDTFCSEMATYQSSGLKIRMDGGLSTLSRDRKS
jgi:hypothetical protein